MHAICHDGLLEYTEVPEEAKQIRFVMQRLRHREGVKVTCDETWLSLNSWDLTFEMEGFRDRQLDGPTPAAIDWFVGRGLVRKLHWLWLEWR